MSRTSAGRSGAPGNLASPGAAVAGDLFVAAFPGSWPNWPRLSWLSGAAHHSGEVSIDVAVATDRRVGALSPRPHRHHPLDHELGGYTRLSCGRGTSDDYDVRIIGDRGLAERILGHLSITP